MSSFIESNSQKLNKIVERKQRNTNTVNNKYTGKTIIKHDDDEDDDVIKSPASDDNRKGILSGGLSCEILSRGIMSGHRWETGSCWPCSYVCTTRSSWEWNIRRWEWPRPRSTAHRYHLVFCHSGGSDAGAMPVYTTTQDSEAGRVLLR